MEIHKKNITPDFFYENQLIELAVGCRGSERRGCCGGIAAQNAVRSDRRGRTRIYAAALEKQRDG
jgi:hypothetical protein